MNKQSQYFKAGFDAGLNGPNSTNCHFDNFATKERTQEWESGQQAGKSAKAHAKNDKKIVKK